jgi:invasion protein IalB
VKRALVLVLLVVAYPVFDKSAAEASDPRAQQLTYEPWTKMCFRRADGNSDCFISAAARGACYPSGGGVSVSIRDEKILNLLVNFATKRALEGGINVQIDQDNPILIPHPECFGLGCRGQLKIDREFIERLKRSQRITIDATDAAGQRIGFSFSLTNFSEAYDGPGTEPKVREEIVSSETMKARECKE